MNATFLLLIDLKAISFSWAPSSLRPRNETVKMKARNHEVRHGVATPTGIAAQACHCASRPVIARNEAIYWRLHNDMDCHGDARLAMTE
jgi:hypothetical protein